MKSITYKTLMILGLFFSSNLINAQDIFIGTWEYQEGNEIFRVNLQYDFTYGEAILGHYEKVELVNGVENYIFSSKKEDFVGNNEGWLPYVINLNGNNESVVGTIHDNTVDENLYDQLKNGQLTLSISSNTGGLNPTITANWQIKRQEGLITNEAPEYSVPTNIILTKIN